MSEAVVSVVMGSDSDWPTMKAAAEVLEEFGVANEADVVSARRMPKATITYGATAHARGLRVIIAGAGGGPSAGHARLGHAAAGYRCAGASKSI